MKEQISLHFAGRLAGLTSPLPATCYVSLRINGKTMSEVRGDIFTFGTDAEDAKYRVQADDLVELFVSDGKSEPKCKLSRRGRDL